MDLRRRPQTLATPRHPFQDYGTPSPPCSAYLCQREMRCARMYALTVDGLASMVRTERVWSSVASTTTMLVLQRCDDARMPDNCKCVRTVHGQHLSEQHSEKSQSFPRLKAPLCYFNETGFRRSGTHTPLVPTDWVAPRSALLDLPISQPNLTCPHHHSPHSPQYSCCLVGGRFLHRGGRKAQCGGWETLSSESE